MNFNCIHIFIVFLPFPSIPPSPHTPSSHVSFLRVAYRNMDKDCLKKHEDWNLGWHMILQILEYLHIFKDHWYFYIVFVSTYKISMWQRMLRAISETNFVLILHQNPFYLVNSSTQTQILMLNFLRQYNPKLF